MQWLAQFHTKTSAPATLAVVAVAVCVGGWLFATADDVYPSDLIAFGMVWAGVLVGLLIIGQLAHAAYAERLVLVQVLWCNLGVVSIAALAPQAERLVLMVVPVFGLLYATLYIPRPQVLGLALGTWSWFTVCSLSLDAWLPQQAGQVWVSITMLALLLAAGALLAWQIRVERQVLLQRNHALREALERVQELALKDELTGVHNRRYLMDVLARQKALVDRHQGKFTICFCDLDHFKRVNDVAGHVVGDDVLRSFAAAALNVVRNVDYVARFGGEEFVLLLVDADEAVAQQVADRLAARTKRILVPGQPDMQLSVSIGLTSYRQGEGVDDVLRRADDALYKAKHEGRDRVVIAS